MIEQNTKAEVEKAIVEASKYASHMFQQARSPEMGIGHLQVAAGAQALQAVAALLAQLGVKTPGL